MKILTWGICLVVFCLPLYLVRFEVFGIPTTILEILIYALFIFWLITRLRVTGYGLRITKLSIPIILIVIGITLATIFSSDLRVSAGIWKAWFVDPILFFIVLISVIKSEEQIKKVLYSLLLSGTIIAIISLIYLILGKFDPVGRLQAFYNSPNYLAMYLAPALVIGLIETREILFQTRSLAHRARSLFVLGLARPDKSGHHGRFGLRKVFKSISLISLLLILIVLYFTHSYGAWLGIIVAIGIGLGLYLYKRNKKLILVVICLGLLLILGLGYLKFNQPEADQSLDARLIIWQKALQIFKENPILGIGPGTFGSYSQPHNIFLAFLLQTGIIGFIGFIWLLIWFFRNFQFSTLPTGRQVFNFQLLSLMVYILVHGLVDTTYWKNDLAVVFWLVVGLMVVLRIRKLEFH